MHLRDLRALMPRGEEGEVLLKVLFIRASLLLFSIFILGGLSAEVVNAWVHWDGYRYVTIAKEGYTFDGGRNIVWYPLYPFLIHIAGMVLPSIEVAAITLSTILAFAAALVLYRLLRLDLSKKEATNAVWLMSIFPTAFFFQAGYTESLFLFLTAASILAFRKEHYILAAFLGALSALTRPTGVILATLFAAEAVFEGGQRLKKVLAACAVGLGTFAYLGINWYYFADPFFFRSIYAAFQSQVMVAPWTGFLTQLEHLRYADTWYGLWDMLSYVVLFG